MLEIHIPGKEPVQTEFVGRIGNVLIFADKNSRPIATGEFTGAGELTDLGISYEELDRRLNLNTNPDPSPEVSV